MLRALSASALVFASAAFAQTAPQPAPATPAEKAPAAKPAPAPAPAAATDTKAAPDLDEVRQEVDAKVENAKKEMREEIRAQLATQSVAQGWQEEWVEEKRKLELFEIDGYLRTRPELFHNFDLGREEAGAIAPSQLLFPLSGGSGEHTLAGANMRFRFEPTLNVSEEVRVRMQVDALDNVVLGSTPDYAASRLGRTQYGALSETMGVPRSAINAVQDSISVRRVYGEVSTPLGILRFGRMGSQWGLGMFHNDGNCLDCDFGETVDRFQFVAEPLAGWFVIPMFDFNVEGPTRSLTSASGEQGQVYDADNADDAHSLVLVLARRDTEQQAKARLENDLAVFNYGLHFTYRTQRKAFVPATALDQDPSVWVRRDASVYMPDLWARYERKNFRLEFEAAAVFGQIGDFALTGSTANLPDPTIDLVQYGAVLQGEFRFMDNALKLTARGRPRLGRSGARASATTRAAPAAPTRSRSRPSPATSRGPQFGCGALGCASGDHDIRNFRFARDYRVDEILYREILGGITDSIYFKPALSYSVADGFDLFGAAIYSRAMFRSSTPSQLASDLGLEFDAGARYVTEDGFFANLTWGVLFPLDGLKPFGLTKPETSISRPR